MNQLTLDQIKQNEINMRICIECSKPKDPSEEVCNECMEELYNKSDSYCQDQIFNKSII